MPRILPLYDAELTRPVARRLPTLGVEVLTGAKATRPRPKRRRAAGRDSGRQAAQHRRPTRSWSRSAAGRATEGWGLERLDLDMDGPFIHIDDQCRTSMRSVWAIGDVTGEPMLAHRAMAQGEMVAEIVAGQKRAFDKRRDPGRLLHRSGDRHRRPVARRGAQGRPRDHDRPVSLPGQRPRA